MRGKLNDLEVCQAKMKESCDCGGDWGVGDKERVAIGDRSGHYYALARSRVIIIL